MTSYLYVADDTPGARSRATALGCGWMSAVPPQFAQPVGSIPLPLVIVAGAGLVTVIPDIPPTTPAAVTSAAAPMLAAETVFAQTQATNAANAATMQANIQTHIGQLETWLTANPNGAVLTAAQTKFLAQCLVGVGRVLLGLTSTVGGAT